MDDCHFLVDLDNKRQLAFRGDRDLRNYKEVVVGGEGMTINLRIDGGPEAYIGAPFFIFKNRNRYSGEYFWVYHRTYQKTWIDRT